MEKKDEIMAELKLYIQPHSALEEWLNKPNPAFGDSNPPPTPSAMLESEWGLRQLEQMIVSLRGDIGS